MKLVTEAQENKLRNPLQSPTSPNLIKGAPYMGWVKITPYYEAGKATPLFCRFNEIISRKAKEDKPDDKILSSTVEREEL